MKTYSCTRECKELFEFGQPKCYKCGTNLTDFWKRLQDEVDSERLAERNARGGPSRYHGGSSGNGGYYGI